jgi:hypothetical protein
MTDRIRDVIKALSDHGWTDSDFKRNHLSYAAALHLGSASERATSDFLSYWRTVARITSLLQAENVFHVVIKTRRNYPYGDTNVDVFINVEDWPQVRGLLCSTGWRMPSPLVVLKQRMIEREKIKLPPEEDGLVPAHLYMSVSWRYQREVSFLDPKMIVQVPLIEEAPQLREAWGSVRVPMPTRAADILLHCAEIVFENYRITLGETMYLRWLLEHVSLPERRRVYRLGVKRGAAEAIRVVLSGVPRGGDMATTVGTATWPRNLLARELLTSWRERFRTQRRSGRVMSGCEEWMGYAAFASMYGVKRALFE